MAFQRCSLRTIVTLNRWRTVTGGVLLHRKKRLQWNKPSNLGPVCTNQSTRHMHRVYDHKTSALWGCDQVLDSVIGKHCGCVQKTTKDNSLLLSSVVLKTQVWSNTINASCKFHHTGVTIVQASMRYQGAEAAACSRRSTCLGTCTDRNRTARVSIGRHRTHDKNTNLQIAAGSGSIGWHGVVLIWGPMVVECHIVAWFDPPNVISVFHVSLAHTAVFNWWFVSSVAVGPQIIN